MALASSTEETSRDLARMETMMQEDEHHGDRWFKEAVQQAKVAETIQAMKAETRAQGTPLGETGRFTVAHLRDFRKTLESQTPLGRIGQTEDLAPAAVFFASSDSKWTPAKHYSSREVFVRQLQKMTSTTRKENQNENEITTIQERDHEQAGREETGNEGTHGCHRP